MVKAFPRPICKMYAADLPPRRNVPKILWDSGDRP